MSHLSRRRGVVAVVPAVLALCVLWASSVASTPAPRGLMFPKVFESKLANGIPVYVVEHHELPLVSVRVVLRGAGAMADPADKSGLADMVAEAMTRGAAERGAEAFAEAVEGLGASLFGRASIDESYVEADGAVRDLDTLVALLADAVMRPKLASVEVGRIVRRRMADLKERYDRPGLLASDGLLRWVYGAHPYGHPLSGTRAGIRDIDSDDVSAFYARHVGPGAAFVVVAGDVNPAEVTRRLDVHFGSWKNGGAFEAPVPLAAPRPPARGRTLVIIDRPDIAQVSVKLAVPAPSRKEASSRYAALMVANAILTGGFTSRLVDRLRVDEGLVYSIDSGFEMNAAGGYFDISTSTHRDSARELVDLTWEIVSSFLKEGPTEEELIGAKAFLRGSFPLELETPDGLSAAVHEQIVYGLDPRWTSRYLSDVAAVTREDARAALQGLFAPKRVGLILAGPAKDLRKAFAGWAKRVIVKHHDAI